MDSFGGYSMCTRCTKNTYAPFMIDNDMMMGKKEKLNITTFNISFVLINYLLFCIDLYSKYKYNNFGIIIITYYETLQSIYFIIDTIIIIPSIIDTCIGILVPILS